MSLLQTVGVSIAVALFTIVVSGLVGLAVWIINKVNSLEGRMIRIETEITNLKTKSLDGGTILSQLTDGKKNYLEALSAILGAISVSMGLLIIFVALAEHRDISVIVFIFVWSIFGGVVTFLVGVKSKSLERLPKIFTYLGVFLGWSFSIFIILLLITG